MQQQQQHQTTECMDAVNDVYEKIRMKQINQMKQAREMCEQQTQAQVQAQQQQYQQQQYQQQQPQYQQPQYEIRDPHGILYLLRSRL